jgi:hypothetical protein
MLPVAPPCIWPRFGVSSGSLIVRTLGCGGGGREGRDAAAGAHCCPCTWSQSMRRCWPCVCPLRVGRRIADTNGTLFASICSGHATYTVMGTASGRVVSQWPIGWLPVVRVPTTPHHTATYTDTRERTWRTRQAECARRTRWDMSPMQTVKEAAATTERR